VKARVFPSISRRLLGHAGHDVESRVYEGSLEFSAKDLSEEVEKVRFPLSGEGVS
jgi:hypothetical protein